MKTVFDIITVVYDVLNVDMVTDLLTGGISRNKRPEKYASEQRTDIVIVPLTLSHSEDIVDSLPLNINIYAPTLGNNQVDETKLNEITANVIEAILAHSNTNNYEIIEIGSQDLITDDREQAYVNLRVNLYVEQ